MTGGRRGVPVVVCAGSVPGAGSDPLAAKLLPDDTLASGVALRAQLPSWSSSAKLHGPRLGRTRSDADESGAAALPVGRFVRAAALRVPAGLLLSRGRWWRVG
jgi:hypothetical protein